MTLPSTFKFTADDGCFIYDATLLPSLTYKVSWQEDGRVKEVPYSSEEASCYIRTGDWKILHNTSTKITDVAQALGILISGKKDTSELACEEVEALRLVCRLITRFLDGR